MAEAGAGSVRAGKAFMMVWRKSPELCVAGLRRPRPKLGEGEMNPVGLEVLS